MSESETVEKHISNSVKFAAKPPIMITADETQDHAGWRTFYVLCLSIAGVIMGDMLIFIYFISFHPYG
jgi:hypothetical protein